MKSAPCRPNWSFATSQGSWSKGAGIRLDTGVAPSHGAATARCIGCGGLASISHACGAPLCQHCIGQFPSCPKCGQPVTTVSSRPLGGVTVETPSGRTVARGGGLTGLKGVFQRKPAPAKAELAHHEAHPAKPAAPTRPESPTKAAKPAGERPRAPSAPAARAAAKPAPSAAPAPPAAPAGKATTKPEPEPPAPVAPAPRPRREKPDDEPRL